MLAVDNNIVKETYATVFGEEFPELLKLFIAEGEIRKFEKGQPIFREGEDAEGFFWILEGFGKICKCFRPDNEQILTLIGPGDFTGVTAFLGGGRYKKDSVSLSDEMIALYLPRESFFEWFRKHPSISLPLLRQLESKIDRIENRASFFMRKTIDQRLAHTILTLRKKFGLTPDGYLRVRLSPQEMASFIGTTRTTIYRILKRFETSHAVRIDQKRIRLINEESLRLIAS
jgi:CRP-like cAMP-binding protein